MRGITIGEILIFSSKNLALGENKRGINGGFSESIGDLKAGQPFANSIFGQFGQAVKVQLSHDLGTMGFDRFSAYV